MKEKIENFFYYYKVHMIVAVCVVLLIVMGFRSFTERTMPDLKMVYFSDVLLSEESSKALEDDLKEKGFVRDINGDGEEQFYMDVVIHDFDIDGTSDEATINKIQTIVYAGDHTLMLAHKYALEDYDGCFEDISDRASDGFVIHKSPENGYTTGISVKGNTYLESLGINTDNLYLAMRLRTQKELENGKYEEEYKLAYEVMDYILSFNEVTD